MRKNGKILSVLLCLLLMTNALAACGSEKESAKEPDQAALAVNAEDSQAKASANAEADEPAVTEEPKDPREIELEEDAAFYREILEKAEARKESIRNSETNIQIQGTAYYVSSSTGDDNNDGLSPETAWKTLQKVTEYNRYQDNDGILLKRGDEFRGSIELWDKENLTISTYGEGPKPLIMGSPENGSGEEKWSLVPGTDNIWVYYREICDCGSVTFNRGEAYADKFNVYWNGTAYTKVGTDEPFDVTTELTDMSFFCDIDYTERTKDPNNYNPGGSKLYVYGAEETGKLFLRCDAGNPGKLYEDVEFAAFDCQINIGAGSTLDNLCMYYARNNAVFTQPGESGCNMTNCEVAFMGDAVIAFDKESKTASTGGEGASFTSYGSECRNNYIHDGRQGAYTIETGWDGVVVEGHMVQGGHVSSGNVFENCHKAAIGLTCFHMGDTGISIEDIVLEDNYFIDIGYDYKTVDPRNDPTDVAYGAINIWMGGDSVLKNLSVRNNVFFRAHNTLMMILNIPEGSVEFDGNTYVQGMYSKVFELTYKDPDHSKRYVCYAYDEAEFEKGVREILGDQNAKVYTYYNGLENKEAERAKDLDLIPASAPEDLSTQITSKELTELLGELVDRLGTEEQKKAWADVSRKAAGSSAKMYRSDAMLAFFEAAYALETVEFNGNCWEIFNKMETSVGKAWEDFYNLVDVALYPNSEQMTGIEWYEMFKISDLAYLYAMEWLSPAAEQHLFPYDSENNTMHCSEPMTWESAIRTAVRFYDSMDPLAFRYYLP